MELTWYGMSCFRISGRGKTTLLTDPYSAMLGLTPGGTTRTDVITVSHNALGHSSMDFIKGAPYVLSTPGEYEIGGTFFTGVALHTVAEEIQRYNIGYLVNYDGVKVFHAGDLSHVPSQAVAEEIGEVNVLLLPVGGGSALTAAQASDVVAVIEPNYIIPMHYALPGLQLPLEGVDRFLKVMGISTVQEEDVFKLAGRENLPEQPEVILLRANLQAQ